jgi:hypothetical protein
MLAATCALVGDQSAALAAEFGPAETVKQDKAPPPVEGGEIAGVTVTASKDVPHVAATFPAKGSSVAPGVLVMRVTYDTRMQGRSWTYLTSKDGEYPECAATPRLLDDHKSFALICRTLPNKTYALWLNHGDHANFTSVSRRPAEPFELIFKTSDADPVWTLQEAIKADPGLPPGSNPAEAEGKRRPGEAPPDTD